MLYIKKTIDVDVKNFDGLTEMYEYMNKEFGSEFSNVDTEEDDDEYALILSDQEIQAIY